MQSQYGTNRPSVPVESTDDSLTGSSGERRQLLLNLAPRSLELEQMRRGCALSALVFGEAAPLASTVYVEARDRGIFGKSNSSLKLFIATKAQRYR